ncbi:hypothetical protein Vadar_026766 [Vaccinium darrowii]|uniref:Uncharacterized protein n=1 Tax=Vaccinium darrowii TaxID=229202 RepID=A0ACB7X463_9ERIC|nr:hypothetical protein Vadar_026766 [Vaccinium darrowii]
MGNTNSTKLQRRRGGRQPPPPSPPAALAAKKGTTVEAEESAKKLETCNFICEICIEPVISPKKKFTNNGLCAHPFCIDCINKYIRVKIEHDHVAEIKCPRLNCNKLLDPLTCRAHMPPELFEKWCDMMCERALLGLERRYCPNRECSEVVVNERGGNVKKSKCPNCNRMFCFRCGIKWHAGFRCEESGEMRDMNDVAFGVLAETKNWTRCPLCKHFVELVDGCTNVKCRCGISFCYKCGRELHRWDLQIFGHHCTSQFISLGYGYHFLSKVTQ